MTVIPFSIFYINILNFYKKIKWKFSKNVIKRCNMKYKEKKKKKKCVVNSNKYI